ncbi:MAG: GSCFA domain-containing protein [Leeuwenhoekiella sp.]
MELQTRIPIEPSQVPIDYNSRIFLVGSCFVENIGAKLDYYKFQHLINPFGILFHPAAIAKFLDYVVAEKTFTEEDLINHNERWLSLDAHSVLSASVKDEVLNNLNTAVTDSREFLKTATHAVVTLGTSWGYKFRESGNWVANCHKIPQKQFNKELASVEEIQANLHQIITDFRAINPNISVVFTVSPVRHIKDGFVQNQLSKAHLLTALHRFLAQSENTFYFPSYEIMMDELRDYRFYDRDMLHPNQLAVDYIWDRFTATHISAEAHSTMTKVEEIQRGLAHRPFNPNSEAHKKFLQNLETKKLQIQQKFPHIELF